MGLGSGMGSAAVVPSGVHAVLAIDPGGTTGVAAAYVDLQRSLLLTLQDAGRVKTAEVSGYWRDQGKELADIITRFEYAAQVEARLPAQNVHVAWEDYQRRPHASDNSLQSVWVMASACAYLDRDDLDMTFQQPSDAKGLATNERLKLWGLWVVGSEHKRDAMRHLALRVNGLLDGK